MKKTFILFLVLCLSYVSRAQTFTSPSGLLNNSYHSGGVVGVADMNNDGYDDIIIMDESNMLYIEYQNADGTFSDAFIGQMGGGNQWGMAAGDLDNDGHLDVISGGYYDGLHVANINSATDHSITTNNNSTIFMQGMSMGDINHDGWLDAYGCHDDGEGNIWGNDGAGNLQLQNSWIDMSTTPISDNSGNYGSVFCDVDGDGDMDLYIAKCRQGVTDPNDPRRINALFINDGNNNFTEEAGPRGLAPHKQSWSSDFMDMDNDGDFDCFLTNHDYSLMVFENDGNGYFTDITQSSGMQNTTGFFLQGKFADFDNDGFIDLLYAGGDAGMFHNNGDNTFTQMSVTFNDNDVLHSFGIGDLNHDGSQDFYASYGDGYVNSDSNHSDKVWLNDGNSNNWLTFQLDGSTASTIGAIVKIYGDWGVQMREVRGGESYGIVNSFAMHFGIGSYSSVDYATIEWPSGQMNIIENPAINQFIMVTEVSDCPDLSVSIAGSTGTVLCPGETVQLTANTSATNLIWTDGSTASSIEVTQSGNYSAIVFDDNGCAANSETIAINYYELIEPEVSAQGNVEFCAGESVELIVDNVQEGNTYTWSNGDVGTTTSITSTGEYTVETLDGCNNTLTSSAIAVEVMEAPDPNIEDQLLIPGESVTFTSTTEDTYWYDSPDAQTLIAEGMEFITPVLNENTTYWAQTSTPNTQQNYTGGKMENGDGHYHSNSDYWMYFNTNSDVTINAFKVYAGSAGNRTIFIEDAQGNEVFNASIFIPEGESYIEINAFIPQGDNYAIRTQGDPDLWRDHSESDLPYPYNVGNVLSITGTNINSDNWNNYYYFFYDWHVSAGPEVCYSDLVEIHAATDVSVADWNDNRTDGFSIYPNPFTDNIIISLNNNQDKIQEINIYNAIGELVVHKNIDKTNLQDISIDVSQLKTGIYTINIMIDNQLRTKKILKK